MIANEVLMEANLRLNQEIAAAQAATAEAEAEREFLRVTLLAVLERQGSLKMALALALGWLSNHKNERPTIYAHLRDLEEDAGCQHPSCLLEDAQNMLQRLAAFESLG